MSKYPLTEALGVNVHYDVKHKYVGAASMEDIVDYVSASDLEAALAKAPVVYRNLNAVWHETPAIAPHDYADTFSARLVCVEAIRKDTAESLLREFFDLYKSPNWAGQKFRDLSDRVGRLLGEGK